MGPVMLDILQHSGWALQKEMSPLSVHSVPMVALQDQKALAFHPSVFSSLSPRKECELSLRRACFQVTARGCRMGEGEVGGAHV